MDNGLFEGVTHTVNDLVEKINLVKPNIFIVPDSWNDTDTTFKNAKYWMNVIKPELPEEVNLMVVMQGTVDFRLKMLYEACVELGYTHFAFNHSSELYQRMFFHPNKLINQMYGRQQLLTTLKREAVINTNHYIHLLGASLPQEFLYYKDPYFNFIDSVDTSSPIINGALGITYEPYGLFTKPKNKIEEFFEDSLEEQIGNITFNINKFKEFVK
jgi:hypothetical protein